GSSICGTILAIDNYLPKYKSGEEGIIINIASIAGIMPFGFCPIYSAAKHGVVALSRCFGQQEHYERSKVRVIAICPGYMEFEATLQSDDRYPEYYKIFNLKEDDFPVIAPGIAAERLVDIMKTSSNGSVWVIEGDEKPYEVVFPNFRKVTTVTI
ncbi:hypothetical protein ILUMI_15484, partial [Ignelater luminosus]